MEQLVKEAQQGRDGQAAFAEVCQRFTGLVKKYTNQPHLKGLKEEATAEGWLAVATAVQTYDRDSGTRFAGYVESKVKYAVWNLFKRQRRRWQQELPLTGGGAVDEDKQGMGWLDTVAAADNVEAVAEANFVNCAVGKAMDTLPSKQRMVVVKTLLKGARLADVAKELGISPQAVYGLRQRGLTQLKKELANSLL